MDFEAADNYVHSVESQWHYPIMRKHGYVADTKEAPGFVRTYKYTNPSTGHSMSVTTGARSDHWTDAANRASGYWSSLDEHLASLTS